MKKNIIITSIIIILVIVGILGIVYQNKNSQVVKIGHLPILASLPLYVAQENGYFTEQGIEIEVSKLQSSNQLVDALVRGDIDIVVESSAVPALIVETIDSNKLKIFSVSDITPETPFDSVIVKADSTLTTLKDLENKKIGVFPGSTATNLLKKYLTEQGIDISTIEFIQIIPPTQLSALYEGSIDALHPYEPSTTIAIESGNAKKIYGSVYANQLNHNPQGVALVSTAFIKSNPELAKKTIAAFDKASDFIEQNDEETRKIIEKYVGVDENVANKVVLLYMGRSDKIDTTIMQEYADMIFEIGELEGRVDVSDILYSA